MIFNIFYLLRPQNFTKTFSSAGGGGGLRVSAATPRIGFAGGRHNDAGGANDSEIDELFFQIIRLFR
jgi:hypothetical protein